MPKIELTRGKVAVVDDCDYGYLNQWDWHFSGRYALRRMYRGAGSPGFIFMHRVVARRYGLDLETYHVDHIDMDSLNNRRTNLRLATHAENLQNRGKPCHNTSGYKGVKQYGSQGKWRVSICVDSQETHIGCFDTKEEAAKAWNVAALKYHGEFAYQNPV